MSLLLVLSHMYSVFVDNFSEVRHLFSYRMQLRTCRSVHQLFSYPLLLATNHRLPWPCMGWPRQLFLGLPRYWETFFLIIANETLFLFIFFFFILIIFQALAAEMAPDTRVNCVAPGFVPTHFAEFLTSNEAIVSIFSNQNRFLEITSFHHGLNSCLWFLEITSFHHGLNSCLLLFILLFRGSLSRSRLCSTGLEPQKTWLLLQHFWRPMMLLT